MADYDTWKVTNTTTTPHTLGQWNSVCTVSNGYLGLKGNLCEQRDGFSPVTLINGLYDELDMFSQIRASNEPRRYLDARYFDTAGKSPAVANLPSPLLVRLYLDEQEVSLERGAISGFQQVLDLATGVYRYSFEHRDGLGRTTRVEMERFAALRHAHRVYMRYSVTPVDHDDTPIRIHSGIDGTAYSNTTRERQYSVTERWADPAERCRMVAQTPARRHEVRIGVQHIMRGGQPTAPVRGVTEHASVYTRYEFVAKRGQTITLERCIALTCSEDLRHRCVAELEAELDAAAARGFDEALREQTAAWKTLWEQSDVQIDGDDPAQLGLRFCLFHLLQAAPRFTDRLSVPVKLLSGEYYQGNTFYDTDTYILPFYTFTQPDVARTCLAYRHEGLRAGREIARNLGHKGAKLAWQAGPNGEECLGRWWRFTHTNIHINADVSYALMEYVRASGDERFMWEQGIDLLVETARFYASRAVHDRKRDTYDLVDVAGPDEGHCESTNNFYTNYLAQRNLRWAADVLDQLARNVPDMHAAAVRRLALGADEPALWRRVADGLTLLYDEGTQRYEQCAGFYELLPAPKDLLDERAVWFVTVAPYQALNQPDVLMAMMLFREAFEPDVLAANYDFYYGKSMNFSSMSFVINAITSAEVGRMDEAYKNFIITCGEDLDEALTGRKDTYAGLHGTACGGAWMAAVLGFGGVSLTDDGLCIKPNLPAQWSGLRFGLCVRGVRIQVAIDRSQVALQVGRERNLELPATIAGQPLTLRSGETYAIAIGE